MTTPIFSHVAIIGLGLIGSSIARALRASGLADVISASDIQQDTIDYAIKEGFIDGGYLQHEEAAKRADLVVLAVPPAALKEVMQQLQPVLRKGMVLTDVLSVKQTAMEIIHNALPAEVEYVPSHPIAGREHSGVAAGRADLFDGKRVIVTPSEPQQTDALSRVASWWKALGGRVEAMPASVHDTIYSYVSHLPQLLSYAARHTLAKHAQNESLTQFLRISYSDSRLWADIFANNKGNLIAGLDRYLDAITHVQYELSQAPHDANDTQNETLAYATLFPRIASACLITTVMEAEKNAGIPFARYAGTGFTDFVSPARMAPEDDIERISNQHLLISLILKHYIQDLATLKLIILEDNWQQLQQFTQEKAH
ncbi:MAG: prephenate dehydrogenase/arogenate dehydrogenase family protein [Rickettsiales bacterium]|nr:prephenate dehydrogenase/arogenate dehydrogenase family protein [Rickettsiales bacterium]